MKALCEKEPVRVNYYPIKFGRQRRSGSRNIMFFVYHVTFQDNMIKGLYDVMVWSPLRKVTILPSLVAIYTVVEEIL